MNLQLRPALVLFGLLTVITGVLYPAITTGLAQAIFPSQANGSLIVNNGKVVGSALIGQNFTEIGYFWGRPSSTGPMPYNGGASSGSNLGPTNPALLEVVKTRVATLKAANPTETGPVPVDLVTASASGLDPHISPAAANYQVERVATARQLPVARVRQLVLQYTEGSQWGAFGEPRVNVLALNLALDALNRHPA